MFLLFIYLFLDLVAKERNHQQRHNVGTATILTVSAILKLCLVKMVINHIMPIKLFRTQIRLAL